MRRLFYLTIISWMAASAFGVSLDGSIVGDGYSQRSLQKIQTGFGGGFNELAGAYAKIEGGNLNLAITGKIEGFNKALIFFDTDPHSGENTLTADVNNGGMNPDNDLGAGDSWANHFAGFTFDQNFTADFLIIPRAGFFGSNKFDFDFNSVGNTSVVEESSSIFGDSQTGINASVGASGIGVAYDNSLIGGSMGNNTGDLVSMATAQAISSGLEFVIPLAALGNPNLADVKVSVMLSNGDMNFMANQTLGSLPAGFGNLFSDGSGGYSHLDFSGFSGDQFFTIVPEPASLALAGIVLLGLALVRR